MNGDCILYADDDINDAFFMQYAFTDAGIFNRLQIITDGQAAINYLAGVGSFSDRLRYPLPCLALLDLKMPRKTGLEVLAWIRAQPRFCCLPVIVFTASANPADMEKAGRLGANSFVVKPISVAERSEFARAIRAFWLNFHCSLPASAWPVESAA